MRYVTINLLLLITFSSFGQKPSVPATNLNIINVRCNQFDISWTKGNGTSRVVFVKEGSQVDIPVENEFYSYSTIFAKGEGIGGGNSYCVYKGNLDTITITGLKINTRYHVAVYEFNNNGAGSYEYLTSTYPKDDTVTKSIVANGYLFDARPGGQTSQCLHGNSFQFKNNSTSDLAPLTFSWLFGDGDSSNLKEPKHTYKTTGVKQVTHIVRAPGCQSSNTINDTVHPHPIANFDIDPLKPKNDSIQCWFGNRFTFRNKTTLPTNGIGPSSARYEWSSESVLFSTSYKADRQFTTAGNKTVTLLAVSNWGCRDSISKNIGVLPRVIDPLQVTVTPKSMKLLNNKFTFTNNSSASISHQWYLQKKNGPKYLDSLTGPSAVYSFNGTGIYYVYLESYDTAGCLDILRDSIEVLKDSIVSITFPKQNISIYPNPSGTGTFYIQGLPQDAYITVYDMAGKEILHLISTRTTEQITLAGFGAGSFRLSVRGREISYNYRLVMF